MKKEIIEVLTSKGPLNAKKLAKKTLKTLGEETNESEFEADFKTTLDSLVAKGKVLLVDETYSLATAAPEEGKRKRSSSESVQETVVTEKEQKPKAKKSKNEQPKAPRYEELWKNGEKHWRDGTFDPEYLRTNPDKYVILCERWFVLPTVVF
jgi:hypothetical protein